MALNIDVLDRELEELKRRAELIQDIKRIAANPDGLAILEQMSKNGAATRVPSAPLPSPQDVEGQGDDYSGLTQIAAIRRAIGKQNGQRFVVGNLGDELRAAGVDIDNISIGKVLRRLQAREEIKIALRGSGNTPNQYEATEAFQMA